MNLSSINIYAFFSLYFSIAGLLVILFNFGYLVSLGLFFLIPSIYLSHRRPDSITKPLFYSLVFGLPSVFIFDYISHVSNIWFVPAETGIRVLGAFPVEEIFWAVLYFYIMLLSYQIFFTEKKTSKILTDNTKKFLAFASLLIVLFISILLIDKDLLIIPSFYTYLVMFMITVPAVSFAYRPHYFKKVLPVFLLFLIPLFIYEYVAISTGQWFFDGNHYIEIVNFFGKKIPIEELLFLIFSTPGTICLYELLTEEK